MYEPATIGSRTGKVCIAPSPGTLTVPLRPYPISGAVPVPRSNTRRRFPLTGSDIRMEKLVRIPSTGATALVPSSFSVSSERTPSAVPDSPDVKVTPERKVPAGNTTPAEPVARFAPNVVAARAGDAATSSRSRYE